MKKIVYLLTLLPLFLHAQPEANIWYFGQMAGLDFSNGDPVQLTDGAIQTFEGCATYCDANGQLLFYTNGGGRDPIQSGGQPAGTIWNRNHEVMYDMSYTEGGGFSARQSSLIVPKPGADSVYYLFTMEEQEFNAGGAVSGQPLGRGLSYFEIDMTLNGGLGGVTVADERIYVPAYEGLTGTLHTDGDKYWIIAYQFDENINQFVVVNADGGGFGNEDISLQFVGFDYTIQAPLKMTPAGNWLATDRYLFRFNKTLGEIDVANPITYHPNGVSAYSFTQDSRYFYFIDADGEVKRLDMTASDILATEESVATAPPEIVVSSQMQMANNGFLYFVSLNQDQSNTLVGEIRCPVTATPSVDFELFSYENTDTTFFLGLPNYTDHIFRRRFQDSTRLEPDTLALCAGEMLTLTARIDGPEYLWSTGDTGPSITISQGGDYHVTVTDECGYLTIDNFLVDDLPLPSVEIFFSDGNGLCAGSTLSIQAEAMNADTLYWSTGDTTEELPLTETGMYTVTAANACGEASETGTFTFIDCEPLGPCSLQMPNVFSPNKDGTNDLFGAFTDCEPEEFQLRVYSRWGKLVFDTNDYTRPWEGLFNDEPAPAEVYLYRLVYRLPGETEVQVLQGDVTLVR